MSQVRAIIIAAGEGKRWNKNLGVEKHFIEIGGEKILHRTVRLLKENGVEDIYVVGRDGRYKVKGASLYIPKLRPEYGDADKFMSSRELWNTEGRTMIVYGDCFFTRAAMAKICNKKRLDFVNWCRPFYSRFTGNGGECFVFSFYPENIYGVDVRLDALIRYYKSGLITRNGGWELYKMHLNLPFEFLMNHYVSGDHMEEINDLTEDFDLPETYDKWIAEYNKLSDKERKEL